MPWSTLPLLPPSHSPRFQYLNLLVFLETGRWEDEHPSVVRWLDWAQGRADKTDHRYFYRDLGHRKFGGREVCDCHHPDMIENR